MYCYGLTQRLRNLLDNLENGPISADVGRFSETPLASSKSDKNTSSTFLQGRFMPQYVTDPTRDVSRERA